MKENLTMNDQLIVHALHVYSKTKKVASNNYTGESTAVTVIHIGANTCKPYTS